VFHPRQAHKTDLRSKNGNVNLIRITCPGRTVRLDIRLDSRKITDVLVELSAQPRISVVNRAPISVPPIRTDIRLNLGVTNIRARSLLWISVVVRIIRHGHP